MTNPEIPASQAQKVPTYQDQKSQHLKRYRSQQINYLTSSAPEISAFQAQKISASQAPENTEIPNLNWDAGISGARDARIFGSGDVVLWDFLCLRCWDFWFDILLYIGYCSKNPNISSTSWLASKHKSTKSARRIGLTTRSTPVRWKVIS